MKKKWYKQIWDYIRPLWEGTDGRISLRAAGAMALLIDLISNTHTAFYRWDSGRSMEGAAIVLAGEAGLITLLLGITAYSNIAAKKIDSGYIETVNVKNNEQVNVDAKTVPPQTNIE